MREQLKDLRHKMKRVYIFSYFFRNNPRYTNRYYYSFIEILGPENYFKSAAVRNEWDGARYSFDKMYGLICAWQENFKIFEESKKDFLELKKALGELLKKIDSLKDLLNIQEKDIVSALKSLDNEEAEELLKAYAKLQQEISDLNKEDYREKTEISIMIEEIKNAEKIVTVCKRETELSKKM